MNELVPGSINKFKFAMYFSYSVCQHTFCFADLCILINHNFMPRRKGGKVWANSQSDRAILSGCQSEEKLGCLFFPSAGAFIFMQLNPKAAGRSRQKKNSRKTEGGIFHLTVSYNYRYSAFYLLQHAGASRSCHEGDVCAGFARTPQPRAFDRLFF